MQDKYEKYALMRRHDAHRRHYLIPDFRVLTVVWTSGEGPERRAKNLAKRVGASKIITKNEEKLFLFMAEPQYATRPTNLLSSMWLRGGEDPKHSQIVPQPVEYQEPK